MFSFTAINSIIPTVKRHSSVAVICALLFPFCTHTVAQGTWSGCGPSQTTHQVIGHATQLLHGIEHAPRNAVRLENLKWELPIGAATGLLIAEADQPAANRIQSKIVSES